MIMIVVVVVGNSSGPSKGSISNFTLTISWSLYRIHEVATKWLDSDFTMSVPISKRGHS